VCYAAYSIAWQTKDQPFPFDTRPIADNGQGFDAEDNNAGFGLRNMHERAVNIGALFGVVSQLGKGTRVRLLWKTPS
jgi:signal transduction histidine kinase